MSAIPPDEHAEALPPTRYVPMPHPPLAPQPVTLEGALVRLEPLDMGHHPALCEVGLDPAIWTYFTQPVTTPDAMQHYIETALKGQAAGTILPFATMLQASGAAIGSTRYMNIDTANGHVEIGSTWIAPDWQRTGVNTECKYLLLRHAFETLGCLRVELKTDSWNVRSQTAIARLGARREGVFRNHMVLHDGRVRHSVYFSIILEEWPAVKARLESFMRRT